MSFRIILEREYGNGYMLLGTYTCVYFFLSTIDLFIFFLSSFLRPGAANALQSVI